MRSLALVAIGLFAVGCTTESKPAATPTPAPTPVAVKPVATPVDPSKLPAAYRADAGIPQNVAASLAFIEMMLTEQRPTMELVTCHCCSKSLAQCFLDTATKAAKACSPL